MIIASGEKNENSDLEVRPDMPNDEKLRRIPDGASISVNGKWGTKRSDRIIFDDDSILTECRLRKGKYQDNQYTTIPSHHE